MNFGEVIERVKTRSYIARRANWDDDMFIFADDWETKSDYVLAK